MTTTVTHREVFKQQFQHFAEVEAVLQPNPGGGIEVIVELDHIDWGSGGAVDAPTAELYLSGFEAGIHQQSDGRGTPRPRVDDIRVTLLRAKAHQVDSSEMAFKLAAMRWLHAATGLTGTVRLG